MYESRLGPFSARQVGLHRETVTFLFYLNIECSLALLEMRIALARLVWHYDLSLVEDEPPAYLHRSLAAGPLEVHMKERHISRTNMD